MLNLKRWNRVQNRTDKKYRTQKKRKASYLKK